MQNTENLNGSQRAVILLLSLDEERAVNIVSHFGEEELVDLQSAAETLGTVDADVLQVIYSDFAEAYRAGVTSVAGSGDYLQGLMRQAHGEEKLARLLASPEEDEDAPATPRTDGQRSLAALADSDPEMLGLALAAEHPQVAAAVLAHLEPAVAAVAIQDYPVERRIDLLRRLSKLEAIPASGIADLEQEIGSIGLTVESGGDIDGLTITAALLNELPSGDATDLIERLAEDDPESAVELRRAMFTFEDLTTADKRGLQALLREIPSDTLMISLKTASEELKEMLLGCMSSRAAEMLLEELEVMGPVRLTEVETAQQQVVEVAMRLIDEGKITVEGRGEQMV